MIKRKSPRISIGITSLVVILTVLCLTIFSVLTLSTALNEKRLSEKSSIALKNYYKAETYCGEIANAIGKMWEEKKDSTELQAFAAKNDLDCKKEENEIYFSYHYPIDENQALFVTLCVGDTFEIQSWCIQTTKEWVADQSMQIWDGENMN